MFKNKFIVRKDFILKNRNNENFIVIDARGLKLTENDFVYDKSIILDYKEFSFLSIDVGDYYDNVPYSKEVLIEKFLKYNIDNNKIVLVYTNTKNYNSMGEDGRIKYLLNLCNIDCYILDGGIDEVIKSGFYKKNDKTIDISIDFINKPFLEYDSSILTKELLSCYKDKNIKIVDVRYKEEYDGTMVFDDYVGGHIKGAINFPHIKIYDNDGYLLDNKKIEKMIMEMKISKKNTIILYCSSALRATLIFEIFKMLGYNVRIYHESFALWSKLADIEI